MTVYSVINTLASRITDSDPDTGDRHHVNIDQSIKFGKQVEVEGSKGVGLKVGAVPQESNTTTIKFHR